MEMLWSVFWACKLLLKQVGSMHSWPLCCFLSGSLGVNGFKIGIFLSPLCVSSHFQHWFGLCPTRALFTATQRPKNEKKYSRGKRDCLITRCLPIFSQGNIFHTGLPFTSCAMWQIQLIPFTYKTLIKMISRQSLSKVAKSFGDLLFCWKKASLHFLTLYEAMI